MYKTLVILALFGFSLCGNIDFENCGKGSGGFDYINVDKCEGKKCILKKGDNLVAELKFHSDRDSKVGIMHVFSRMDGKDVELKDWSHDVCEKLDKGSCPMHKGKSYVHKFSHVIRDVEIDTEDTVKIEGEDGTIACAKFKVQIK